MGTHNRRIDKEMACQRTGLRLEPLPELAPAPAPFPAAKAVIDRVPTSKLLWQARQGVLVRARYKTASMNIRSLSTGGPPAGDWMVVRMEAISAHAASVSHKRTDIRFPRACLVMNGREKTYPGIRNSSTRPSL